MENKLTDEEVWLRAYCASMSNSNPQITPDVWGYDAEKCLFDFRQKFRAGENNERPE